MAKDNRQQKKHGDGYGDLAYHLLAIQSYDKDCMNQSDDKKI